MTSKHHQLYLDNIITLARTLVIKSEYSASQVNNEITLRFGNAAVNLLDKTSWKYYLNVSGQYHVTDTPIMVKSLDTMQEIEFNKVNLLVNTATARGYRPGTRYYRELVTKYPHQRLLIHGILFPVDIQVAINAQDFSVLSFPSELVEENEEDLIDNINNWLQSQRKRWYINEFNITDELYCASFMMVMYHQLVPLILTLRKQTCKTFQAHSYHVRQYLISHGVLDSYIDHLTFKQRMFFYRNIRYIHRHAGKEDTFQWLTQNVLTDRNMPLTQYESYHQTSGMPESVLPLIKFRSKSLNTISPLRKDDIEIGDILSKEIPLAPGNIEEALFSSQAIEQTFTYTQTALETTKVLESSSVQESTGVARNIQDAALNLWAYATSTNRYNSYIFVTDPRTGAEISMPALVAYHYFLYAFYKAHKLSLTVVPPVVATQVPKWPGIAFNDLLNMVNTKDVAESTVYDIWNLHPTQRTFPNTDSFFVGVQELLQAQTSQMFLTSLPESFMGRGMAQGVYEALYPTYVYENETTGTSIKEYFAPYELVLEGLDDNQWQQMYLSIFTAATGQSLTSVQLKTQIQKTMINIMAQLSSYSVQFVSDINNTEMDSLSWQTMRFGPGINTGRLYFWLLLTSTDVINPEVNAAVRYKIDLPSLFSKLNMHVPKRVTEDITIGFTIQGVTNVTLNAQAVMPFDGTRMIYDQIPSDNYISAWEDLPNMNGYDHFTQEQLQSLPDVYSHQCRIYPLIPAKIDLEDKFNSFNLPIFKALEVKNSLLRPYQGYSVSGSLRYFKNEVFVIVLNGFENNTGDLTVQALTPTFGRNMLSMFTLTPDFVLHQEKQFFYTGGPLKLGSVKPGASTTDMITPILIGLVPQVSVDINSRLIPGAIMTNFTQGLPALQFSLDHLPPKLEFGFTSKVTLTTLDLWSNSIPSVVLNFGQAVKDLQLSLFTLNNKTITAPVMLRGTRSYVIPNFNQTFQAQGPVLMTYGIQIIDDIEQSEPVEVVDSNIALEFSSVSQIITGSGVEFISETSIIDIPDFEDLFNEPD